MERIRELVKSLSESDVDSPHLDRLRKRLRPRERPGSLHGVQQEILGEMAASLGRAEIHVDEALLCCELLAREIDELEARTADEAEIGRAIDAFNQSRKTAERRRWELMVQREALGIRRHDVLAQHYPIPAERRRKAESG